MQLPVCLIYNKIVDLVHVCFVHILLTQFLMDGLINIILLEVGHLYVHYGQSQLSCQG